MPAAERPTPATASMKGEAHRPRPARQERPEFWIGVWVPVLGNDSRVAP